MQRDLLIHITLVTDANQSASQPGEQPSTAGAITHAAIEYLAEGLNVYLRKIFKRFPLLFALRAFLFEHTV